MEIIYVNICTEDNLSTLVLRKLINFSRKDIKIAERFPSNNRKQGFGYLKANLPAFNNASKVIPYIVLTDLDDKECAPKLIKKWINFKRNPNLIFRIAVREIETWIMADKHNFCDFFGVSTEQIPFPNLDQNINNPKQFLFKLVKKSKKGKLKKGILPQKSAAQGYEYNSILEAFINDKWNIETAISHSDSLLRAHKAIKKIMV